MSNLRNFQGVSPSGTTSGTTINPVVTGGLDYNKIVRSAYISIDGSANIGNSPLCASLNDTFENYDNVINWNQVAKASGDLIQIDGNALGCAYLVMSLDPLNDNTTTYIESNQTWNSPIRMGLMFATSQRTVGQDISFEFVSTDAPSTPFSQLTISTIQQTTTTITVTTTTNHNLKVGDRVSISGVADSRVNYQSLIVSSITSKTVFLGTVNASSNLPSLSVGPLSSGVVNYRSPMGYALDGTSFVLDNATVTNGTFFTKSGGNGSFPSGTIGGNGNITITTTASTALVSSPGNYCFTASNITEMIYQPETLEWLDKAIDSSSSTFSPRLHKEHSTPNFDKSYKLRIRINNNNGFSHPIAQIVSASKAGSTTATITTDVAHGLSTTDYVNIYGINDVTNFGNLTTATIVASIVNSTQFTIVIPTVATATSYGGYVTRCNGAVLQQGAVTQVAQSISRTSNVVTLVGNVTWTGIVIGDYVNLVGIRNTTNGATVGLDGPYRVYNIATTSLVLEPIGSTSTGADVGSTNCGGGVIKRTDLRIDFIRISPFTRNIVETYGGMGRNTIANSIPVTINSNISTNTVVGAGAHASNISGSPVRIGARGVSANNVVTNGQTSDLMTTLVGALITKPFALPELEYIATDSITSGTTAVQIKALTASNQNYVTGLKIQHGALGSTSVYEIRSTPVVSTSATLSANTLVMSATYGWKVGDKVKCTATTGSVTGMVVGGYYYILTVSSANLTFSATRGGSTLTLTGTTVSITLSKILYATELQAAVIAPTSIEFTSPPSGGVGLAIECLTNSAVSGNVYFTVTGYVAP